jgi:cell division septum initiation protein DivIVA
LQLLRDELKINREQTDRLEQIIQIHDQCSSDSRSLLDQLQSEKATVSRAVSQNRELKEQLTELQDKLVTLVS